MPKNELSNCEAYNQITVHIYNFFILLQAEIFCGDTDLRCNQTNVRDKSLSLAKINIQKLIVDGNMKMNGCLWTQAWLQNMVLEDSRPQIEGKLFIYCLSTHLIFFGGYDSLVLKLLPITDIGIGLVYV